MADVQGRGEGGAGDRELLAGSRPELARILSYFRIPPEDAEDLMQDTWLHFLRKRELIENPRSWLRGALRNECKMYWRGRRRRLTVAIDQSLLELAADPEPPVQERKILRKNLGTLIEGMQWRCREFLRLRYLLGYDARETAERMGYKRSSIDKVGRRCLDALGRRLIASSIGRLPREEG